MQCIGKILEPTNPEAKLDVKGSVYINDLNEREQCNGLQLVPHGITGQLAK